jgi:hypothetical protein
MKQFAYNQTVQSLHRAPITKNGNIYTLTSNISFTTNYDGIIIERDNVVLDGAGYSIKQNGQLDGVTLIGRHNVTIRNLVIKDFYWAYFLTIHQAVRSHETS